MKKNRQSLLPVVCCGFLFLLGFESGSLQLALLRAADEFSLSGGGMGALASAQYTALLVMQPLFGVLADRYGKKRFVCMAALVFFSGCLLASLAGGLFAFIGGVFVVGTGYAVIESLCTAALVDAYGDRAQSYMNLTQGLFCAGAVVSPVLVARLIAGTGASWRIGFALPAAGAALLFPLLLAAPFSRIRQAALPEKPAKGSSGGSALRLSLLLLLLANVMYGGIEAGTGSFLDALFARGLDMPQLGAYAISLYWLSMMISRFVFVFVRTDAKKTVVRSMLCSALALAGLSASTSGPVSMLCAAATGFALGPVWAMNAAMAAGEMPERTATAVTLMSAASGCGAALFPMLVGCAADAWGHRMAMLVIGGCGLAGSLLVASYASRKSQ